MSRTHKDSPKNKQARAAKRNKRRRTISVRGVQRDQPDLRKLGRALIDLTIAQAEADAQLRAEGTNHAGQSSE